MNIPKPNNTQPSMDISKTTGIICNCCDCEYFRESYILRKASKLMTGSTQDSIIPIPVMRCDDCGNVNEMFKPKGI